MKMGKIKNNRVDDNIFKKLEDRIIYCDPEHLSDFIDEVATNDFDVTVLYANLDKVFKNVAYKMFAQNDIELNYDVCADINKLLVDMGVMYADYDVCFITDRIEDLMVYYKNIDMCKQLEDKIINRKSKNLGDLVDKVAEDNVDFYTDDLFEALKDLYETEYYNMAVSEPDSGEDILKDIRKAQYFQNKDILVDSNREILINVACRKFSDARIVVDNNVKYNIIYEGMRGIIFSYDGTVCVDNDGMINEYNSIDVIFNKIDELINEYKDSQNK